MNLDKLIEHDDTDDCPACRAQDLVVMALLPAAQAWEQRSELPQFALALHGAAGLLGAMIESGVPRASIEEALSVLLDEIEEELAHEKMLGGPTQGTA